MKNLYIVLMLAMGCSMEHEICPIENEIVYHYEMVDDAKNDFIFYADGTVFVDDDIFYLIDYIGSPHQAAIGERLLPFDGLKIIVRSDSEATLPMYFWMPSIDAEIKNIGLVEDFLAFPVSDDLSVSLVCVGDAYRGHILFADMCE